MSELIYKDETSEIIGLCMEVHRMSWAKATTK